MIALDTKVLIYCCDKRDPRRQKIAMDLVAGVTAAHAWQWLAEFLSLFPLLMPTPVVLERARTLHLEQQWAFWDATLVGACLETGVSRLYSEDLPGRTKIESLEIVSPFA